MSCLDVMYHQSYGAHYLPAAAYKATYYNPPHQHQQRKLSAHSKMQNCLGQQQQQGGGRGGMVSRDQSHRQVPGTELGCVPDPELKDGTQPAGTEYLNSRCVLFTYFHGDISDVVDEHFSRALSQPSTFNSETKLIRMAQPPVSSAADSWKDGASLSEGQGSSLWNGAYPSQAGSCLPSVSVSVHPDFSPSPVSFNPSEGALWAGHMLSPAGLPPLAALPDSWAYNLNSQGAGGYANVHDVYHPHAHIHTRHHHHMLHSYPAQGAALDARFSPLLLPGVRNQSQPAASGGSSPHSEGVKTEIDPSSPVTATSVTWTPSTLHGSLDVYNSARDQTKAKSSVWF